MSLPGVGLSFMRTMAGMLSPAGGQAKLSILIYHRVLPVSDPMLPGDPDAATFRWHMQTTSRLFNILPLGEAASRLASGTLPARAACITFDDGYADNARVALPILRELGIPATFFVAVDYLDGGMMFNDRVLETLRRLPEGEVELAGVGLGGRELSGVVQRAAVAMEIIRAVKHLDASEREDRVQALVDLCPESLPADLMMSTDELRTLAGAGMEIGGHTRTHPILTRIPDAQAMGEIGGGREVLESILGQPVRLFAYPNGKPGQDYDARHVAMVRECGFNTAVSTAWGVSDRHRDPFQLARFTPWDKTSGRFAARLVRNLLNKKPDGV